MRQLNLKLYVMLNSAVDYEEMRAHFLIRDHETTKNVIIQKQNGEIYCLFRFILHASSRI